MAATRIGTETREHSVRCRVAHRLKIADRDHAEDVGFATLASVPLETTETMGQVFDAKRLIDRKFADTVVHADMKLWPFNVLSSSGDKTMIQVQSVSDDRKFHSGEISLHDPHEDEGDNRSVSGHEGENTQSRTRQHSSAIPNARQTRMRGPISGLMCHGPSTRSIAEK